MDPIFLSVAGLAGVGAVAFWIIRRRAARQPYLYFRCPSCDQKLRFLARLAGQMAACPNCRKSTSLPKTSSLHSQETTTASGYRVKRAAAPAADKQMAKSA